MERRRVKSPKLPSGEELLKGATETPAMVKGKRAAVRQGKARVAPVSSQGRLESKVDVLVENGPSALDPGLVGVSQTSSTPMVSYLLYHGDLLVTNTLQICLKYV